MNGNRLYLRFVQGVILTALIFLTADLFAETRRRDYFTSPQIGAWFGPVTPVGSTSDLVDTSLSFGAFFRYNTPFSLFKIGLDTSYQHYESEGVNELYLVPVYTSLIFQVPIDLPIRFQFKLGVGASYIDVKPSDLSRWDPTFTAGFEISFPAGRVVNIGLRIDYLLLYEQHLTDSKQNGHVINSGITLYFNI